MNGNIATPPASTQVEVSAVLEETGETLTCEFTINHPSGTADGMIVATALNQFKQVGGILKDSEGGLDYYMASKFKMPFKLRTKKILMIGV